MATNTYVALDKKTISGSSTASITFTSIPSGYTDLELVINATSVGSSDYAARISFNGDTSSGLYSWTLIRGDGSSASSLRYSGQNDIAMTTNYSIMQTPSTIKVNLQNYSNSSVYKTILGRFSQVNPVGGTSSAFTGLWRNTNAITSITVTIGGDYFASGSTFSLYGILANDNSYTAKATGGTITADAGYIYHTFTSSGTFTPNQALSVDYLVVAGGGGSGSNATAYNGATGGGGAGGLRSTVTATGGGGSLESQLSLTASTGYTVTIGSGGTGGPVGVPTDGTNGSNSVFATITATGGGGGARCVSSGTQNGASGGSGGGGSGNNGTGGAGTTNQGFAGGTGTSATLNSGGGGGAGSAGGNGSSTGGAGGSGVTTAISGSYVTYAGGGGGGGFGGAGAGAAGSGGGGAGGTAQGSAGTANTGGGAGGSGSGGTQNAGANGGSGIVIVRYAK